MPMMDDHDLVQVRARREVGRVDPDAVAAQAVEGILSGVQETSDAARVINLATQQQRTATEQVVASMGEIEDVTRQTTFASRQATGATAELTQLASRLAELIKRFKAD